MAYYDTSPSIGSLCRGVCRVNISELIDMNTVSNEYGMKITIKRTLWYPIEDKQKKKLVRIGLHITHRR